jgi:hypothetical protein
MPDDTTTVTPGSVPGNDEPVVVDQTAGGDVSTDISADGSAPSTTTTPTGSEAAVEELKRERRIKQKQALELQRIREENAYLKGLREGTVQAPQQVKPAEPELVAPNPADFPDGVADSEFRKQEREYIRQTTLRDFEKREDERQKRDNDRRAMEPMQKLHEDFIAKVTRAADELDDPEILDCLSRNDTSNPMFVRATPVTTSVVEAIKSSEVSPQLIRHFLDTRADLVAIYQAPSPAAALRALTKLESRIEMETKTDTKDVSTAPRPIKPVSSTATTTTPANPDDYDVDSFVKHHMKKYY